MNQAMVFEASAAVAYIDNIRHFESVHQWYWIVFRKFMEEFRGLAKHFPRNSFSFWIKCSRLTQVGWLETTGSRQRLNQLGFGSGSLQTMCYVRFNFAGPIWVLMPSMLHNVHAVWFTGPGQFVFGCVLSCLYMCMCLLDYLRFVYLPVRCVLLSWLLICSQSFRMSSILCLAVCLLASVSASL